MIGPGRAPAFWWRASRTLPAHFLTPAAWVYGRVARRNLLNGPRRPVPAPVLCVGNLTVGGGGKTPTALALADAVRRKGYRPGFVSRGHGRKASASVLVAPDRDNASTVGDEPLLLAASAPTAVGADRAEAARLVIEAGGADFIIMDDGFQSQRLAIDCALLVVDGARGLGNRAVVPAGPLRAPLAPQLDRADRFLIVGEDRAVAAGDLDPRRTLSGRVEAINGTSFAGRRLLAFAGIADPGKFYRTLIDLGADLVATRDFADHGALSAASMARLASEADRYGADLVTTAKDMARLSGAGPEAAAFRKRCEVLDIRLVFTEPHAAGDLVDLATAGFARRAGGRQQVG